MGLLEGKRILVTGVLTDSSIAYHVARLCQEQGATVVLTGYGRMSLVQRIAQRLPETPPVLELDVTSGEDLSSLAARIGEHVDGIDGIVHAIGFTPQEGMGGNFMNTSWEDVATAMHTSTFSLKALTGAVLPLMKDGGSVVALDFDNSVTFPVYDWMGVAKSALASTARYLARYLGGERIRVNLVSAGPLRTMAARSIPGFDELAGHWPERAPLGWNPDDPEPAAKAVVALLSDWFPATTGEIVHVDGGFHSTGA